MTDQEINEAVAKKLGVIQTFKRFQVSPDNSDPRDRDHVEARPLEIPDYCRSIEAAWEIPAKYPNAHIRGFDDKEWIADFFIERQTNSWSAGWRICSSNRVDPAAWLSADDDAIPMAICLAFLKLPS